MVRDFHRVIGAEAKEQILAREGRLPDELIACVGGGSNAIGLFFEFLEEPGVRMTGVEAGGQGDNQAGEHAARFAGGKLGVLQGCKTFILQDPDGQIELTHSVSAGLDYAAVGPEHAFYRDRGRIEYTYATDDEVLEAFQLCSRLEGIIPALESAHALAHAMKRARELAADKIIVVNLSGRGDKDVQAGRQAAGQGRMKSMTGYGRASAALAGGTLTVQVNSVNRRSLDLTVRTARGLGEPRGGDRGARAARGRPAGRYTSASSSRPRRAATRPPGTRRRWRRRSTGSRHWRTRGGSRSSRRPTSSGRSRTRSAAPPSCRRQPARAPSSWESSTRRSAGSPPCGRRRGRPSTWTSSSA